MTTTEALIWIADLAFLAFVTIGWSRLFRWAAEKDGDILAPLVLGGAALVGIYAIVLGPTYYLLGGAT